MLKVCLVVDTEKFISFKQYNPRWSNVDRFKAKINSLVKKHRYNEDGFRIIYNFVLREKFPATFMLVGELFKPIKSEKFIDWGYHTLNHKVLTMIDDNNLKEQVKNIYGIHSFCPPLWMVESSENPERVFDALEKEKYKKIIYKGRDDEHAYKDNFKVSPLIKRGKLNLLRVSNTFEGNSTAEHMKKLFRDIVKNLDNEAIYCLCTHDFTHKNNHNLLKVARFLKKLEVNKKIKIVNVKNA